MHITENHIAALKYAPVVSAILSCFGSISLIYLIVAKGETNNKSRSPLSRLLLCLSIADIIVSINWSLGTIPNIEGYAIGARGNEATCTASGFVSYGIAGTQPFYNASIMIFFLLTIRHGWKLEDFKKTHLEKVMHSISAGIPISTGILFAATGYINPTPNPLGRCFVQAFPPDCDVTDGVECERGQHARSVRWTFALGPWLIVYVFLLYSVFMIAWTVRRQARRMSRWGAGNAVSIERRVIVQSLLYGSFFFLTYFWGLLFMAANLVPQKDDGAIRTWLYPIQLLREIFYPLQGFFNFLIFVNGQGMPSNGGGLLSGSMDAFDHISGRVRDMTSKLFYSSKSSMDSVGIDDVADFDAGADNDYLVSISDNQEGDDCRCNRSENNEPCATEESNSVGIDDVADFDADADNDYFVPISDNQEGDDCGCNRSENNEHCATEESSSSYLGGTSQEEDVRKQSAEENEDAETAKTTTSTESAC